MEEGTVYEVRYGNGGRKEVVEVVDSLRSRREEVQKNQSLVRNEAGLEEGRC
jgi:hypothetical protein